MVHLNRVPTDNEVKEHSLVDGIDKIKLEPFDEADDFAATVYGSKWAAEDLPRHCMPEREMPPQVYVVLGTPELGTMFGT